MSFLSGAQSLPSSISKLLCGFIADRWGIRSAFSFLAGALFVANLIVVAIQEGGRD